MLTYGSTSKTSFEYKLNKDGELRTGRVTAIADGALVLITDKAKDPNSTCIWSKQRSAIAFEVRLWLPQLLIIGEESGCGLGGAIGGSPNVRRRRHRQC